ncbi:hypothetical protein [Streptomyces sp. ODS28]|uniref:hypothetical protein n=1 Tax=Streptomyces sp. ODS28 TaxID=3136688 RepID=UPI0031EB43DB
MSQPPSVRPPSRPGAPATPAQAPHGRTPHAAAAAGTAAPPSPQAPQPPHGPAPARRTAWAEGVHRVRAAATTEPGRLRGLGALLAALILLFGLVTAWQVSARQEAARAVTEHSQPLSADAARIYRSLADADTTAAGGFLAGGDEPRSVRQRYEKDIAEASALLAKAAANSGGSRSAQQQIAALNAGLPRYTGLVESARANNRQGLPLGGAYLRYANERMRTDLLPAARKLYTAESARLRSDYGAAREWPWFASAAGVLALGALGWAQRRNYLRTNRVFSPGLLGATAATLAAALWLLGGHTLAATRLTASDEKGARSLHALNEAWIGVLQARGDENMTLVARGAGSAYEDSYRTQMARVAGSGAGGAVHGQLGGARALADDAAGRKPVADAEKAVGAWRAQHRTVRERDDSGDYEKAVSGVIGGRGSTGESFDRVESGLERARQHEQAQFESAADSGRSALTGLAAGAGVLVVLGAAAALFGIGRRLAEYR